MIACRWNASEFRDFTSQYAYMPPLERRNDVIFFRGIADCAPHPLDGLISIHEDVGALGSAPSLHVFPMNLKGAVGASAYDEWDEKMTKFVRFRKGASVSNSYARDVDLVPLYVIAPPLDQRLPVGEFFPCYGCDFHRDQLPHFSPESVPMSMLMMLKPSFAYIGTNVLWFLYCDMGEQLPVCSDFVARRRLIRDHCESPTSPSFFRKDFCAETTPNHVQSFCFRQLISLFHLLQPWETSDPLPNTYTKGRLCGQLGFPEMAETSPFLTMPIPLGEYKELEDKARWRRDVKSIFITCGAFRRFSPKSPLLTDNYGLSNAQVEQLAEEVAHRLWADQAFREKVRNDIKWLISNDQGPLPYKYWDPQHLKSEDGGRGVKVDSHKDADPGEWWPLTFRLHKTTAVMRRWCHMYTFTPETLRVSPLPQASQKLISLIKYEPYNESFWRPSLKLNNGSPAHPKTHNSQWLKHGVIPFSGVIRSYAIAVEDFHLESQNRSRAAYLRYAKENAATIVQGVPYQNFNPLRLFSPSELNECTISMSVLGDKLCVVKAALWLHVIVYSLFEDFEDILFSHAYQQAADYLPSSGLGLLACISFLTGFVEKDLFSPSGLSEFLALREASGIVDPFIPYSFPANPIAFEIVVRAVGAKDEERNALCGYVRSQCGQQYKLHYQRMRDVLRLPFDLASSDSQSRAASRASTETIPSPISCTVDPEPVGFPLSPPPPPDEVEPGFQAKLDFMENAFDTQFQQHPKDQVDVDVHETLSFLKGMSAKEVIAFRESQLVRLRQFAKDLKKKRDDKADTQDPLSRPLFRDLHAPLFRKLLILLCYNDVGAADIIEQGAQVRGWLEGPDSWPNHVKPDQPADPDEVINDSTAKRGEFLDSIRSSPFDAKLWKAAAEDKAAGRMLGPFYSQKEVAHALGIDKFVCSRRFAVVQPDKVRACDDLLRSGGNRVSAPRKKVVLINTDTIAANALLAAVMFPDHDIVIWKRDQASAYRQIPLKAEERKFCVIAFRDPESKKVCFWAHLCLPFGLVASVVEFNRVSQAITFIANRFLRIPCSSYFDDFWSIEPEAFAQSGFDAFGELSDLLGFILKLAKDVPPGKETDVLGHLLTLGRPPFFFSPTGKRKAAAERLILEFLTSLVMSSAEGASLAGKLQFLASAVFGKVARAPLKPIYAMAYSYLRNNKGRSRKTDISNSQALLMALEWFLSIIHEIPPRILRDTSMAKEIRLYCDASTGKKDEQACLGAVFTQRGFPHRFSQWKVPSEFIDSLFKARGNYIQFLEMCAAILALSTFGVELREVNTILYCDNTAQQGNLIKGYGRNWDLTIVSNVFWRIACRGAMNIQIERVPSVENISDIPSRPRDSAAMQWMLDNGAIKVSPGPMSELLEALRVVKDRAPLLDA